MAKLTKLLKEMAFDIEKPNRHEVIKGVSNYSAIGKSLYGEDIMGIAEQLVNITEQAHSHVLSETDDWFDKVTVNKNMQTLKKSVVEFKKVAQEHTQTTQRLQSIYEDMGHILNRYYDINEINEDSGDMDNDGKNEPDDEEYLQNKRTAITKAMKETALERKNRPVKRLKDINNVVGIQALGSSKPFKK